MGRRDGEGHYRAFWLEGLGVGGIVGLELDGARVEGCEEGFCEG